MTRNPGPAVAAAPLVLLVVGYWFLPVGWVRDLGYPVVALTCVGVGVLGVRRWGTDGPVGWGWVVAGFAGWAVGDLLYVIERDVFGLSLYPAPSDLIYLGSYGLAIAGLVRIVRRRGARTDLVALLDGAILATGTAVVAGVFVIVPVAADSTLSALGKLTSSLYPITDVLLIGILVQLWSSVAGRSAALRLLGAALTLNLVADIMFTGTSILHGDTDASPLNNVLWLGSYVLIAAAVWSPSVHRLADPLPGREEISSPTGRLAVLTCGLLLPAIALVGDGLNGGGVSWAVIGAGSALLSLLVLARMAGLLTVVRSQAGQLAALARSDPLTGVANRRTLDFELSRACRDAQQDGTALSVAMLDLDHFKLYNDTHGHPAGDRLLREATAAWSALVGRGQTLARYGGEEFVVLFPGLPAVRAREQVLALLAVTPQGQTFSAGVVDWRPDTEPGTALEEADAALYEAKRSGRNRVCLAPDDVGATTALPHAHRATGLGSPLPS